ncbi:MAG: hypothetical protein IPM84_21870 [Anaerolineae bacterium]|nr:hypothetical protein [Anaerolineae bacterium]
MVQILPEGAVDVAQAISFTAAAQVLKQRPRRQDRLAAADRRPAREGTDDEGWVHLALRVSSRPGATMPDELLEGPGLTDCARRIERTQLIPGRGT